MVSFESPYYLFLLILIPLLIYLSHFYRKRGGLFSFPYKIWPKIGFSPSVRLLKALLFLFTFLYYLGLTILIIALARPVLSYKERVFEDRGVEIMLVLDESPSMAATDLTPVNRFETAKTLARKFIRMRSNDPIGLVTFGKDAVLRSPPTLDYLTLLERLDSLNIMFLGDATAIGMGLSTAALHMSESTPGDKVIILLTDGVNNSGEIQPVSAAEVCRELGIRLYCIGLGTEGRVEIEFTDPETGALKKGEMESLLDESLLIQMAQLTGGAYFSAQTTGALEAVFKEIDSLENVEVANNMTVVQDPIYAQLIFWGLLFILIDFLGRKIWLREVL